jgi:hypothetical protein
VEKAKAMLTNVMFQIKIKVEEKNLNAELF